MLLRTILDSDSSQLLLHEVSKHISPTLNFQAKSRLFLPICKSDNFPVENVLTIREHIETISRSLSSISISTLFHLCVSDSGDVLLKYSQDCELNSEIERLFESIQPAVPDLTSLSSTSILVGNVAGRNNQISPNFAMDLVFDSIEMKIRGVENTNNPLIPLGIKSKSFTDSSASPLVGSSSSQTDDVLSPSDQPTSSPPLSTPSFSSCISSTPIKWATNPSPISDQTRSLTRYSKGSLLSIISHMPEFIKLIQQQQQHPQQHLKEGGKIFRLPESLKVRSHSATNRGSNPRSSWASSPSPSPSSRHGFRVEDGKDASRNGGGIFERGLRGSPRMKYQYQYSSSPSQSFSDVVVKGKSLGDKKGQGREGGNHDYNVNEEKSAKHAYNSRNHQHKSQHNNGHGHEPPKMSSLKFSLTFSSLVGSAGLSFLRGDPNDVLSKSSKEMRSNFNKLAPQNADRIMEGCCVLMEKLFSDAYERDRQNASSATASSSSPSDSAQSESEAASSNDRFFFQLYFDFPTPTVIHSLYQLIDMFVNQVQLNDSSVQSALFVSLYSRMVQRLKDRSSSTLPSQSPPTAASSSVSSDEASPPPPPTIPLNLAVFLSDTFKQFFYEKCEIEFHCDRSSLISEIRNHPTDDIETKFEKESKLKKKFRNFMRFLAELYKGNELSRDKIHQYIGELLFTGGFNPSHAIDLTLHRLLHPVQPTEEHVDNLETVKNADSSSSSSSSASLSSSPSSSTSTSSPSPPSSSSSPSPSNLNDNNKKQEKSSKKKQNPQKNKKNNKKYEDDYDDYDDYDSEEEGVEDDYENEYGLDDAEAYERERAEKEYTMDLNENEEDDDDYYETDEDDEDDEDEDEEYEEEDEDDEDEEDDEEDDDEETDQLKEQPLPLPLPVAQKAVEELKEVDEEEEEAEEEEEEEKNTKEETTPEEEEEGEEIDGGLDCLNQDEEALDLLKCLLEALGDSLERDDLNTQIHSFLTQLTDLESSSSSLIQNQREHHQQAISTLNSESLYSQIYFEAMIKLSQIHPSTRIRLLLQNLIQNRKLLLQSESYLSFLSTLVQSLPSSEESSSSSSSSSPSSSSSSSPSSSSTSSSSLLDETDTFISHVLSKTSLSSTPKSPSKKEKEKEKEKQIQLPSNHSSHSSSISAPQKEQKTTAHHQSPSHQPPSHQPPSQTHIPNSTAIQSSKKASTPTPTPQSSSQDWRNQTHLKAQSHPPTPQTTPSKAQSKGNAQPINPHSASSHPSTEPESKTPHMNKKPHPAPTSTSSSSSPPNSQSRSTVSPQPQPNPSSTPTPSHNRSTSSSPPTPTPVTAPAPVPTQFTIQLSPSPSQNTAPQSSNQPQPRGQPHPHPHSKPAPPLPHVPIIASFQSSMSHPTSNPPHPPSSTSHHPTTAQSHTPHASSSTSSSTHHSSHPSPQIQHQNQPPSPHKAQPKQQPPHPSSLPPPQPSHQGSKKSRQERPPKVKVISTQDLELKAMLEELNK